MKKPKIEINKEEPLTELEKDIIIAGSVETDVKTLQQAIEDGFTFSFSPQVMEQLKELGLTPEQVIEAIQNENTNKPTDN